MTYGLHAREESMYGSTQMAAQSWNGTKSMNKRSLTTHLLRACFEMEEHHAVAARIRYQVLLDEVHIVLHVRLESKQVPMA